MTLYPMGILACVRFLASDQAIAITIGKRQDGTIVVFGSGRFRPPGGGPLTDRLKELAAKLVE